MDGRFPAKFSFDIFRRGKAKLNLDKSPGADDIVYEMILNLPMILQFQMYLCFLAIYNSLLLRMIDEWLKIVVIFIPKQRIPFKMGHWRGIS